jgi:predicted ATPase
VISVWIARIKLENVRSFENETIEFSKGINVLVGPNNAGKSTIAHAVLWIQKGFSIGSNYLRSGADKGDIWVDLEDTSGGFGINVNKLTMNRTINRVSTSSQVVFDGGRSGEVGLIEQNEPLNFIYPHLSKRKVTNFEEQVSEQFASAVTGNLRNLYAKVDKVSNPQMPAYHTYVDVCERVLGFVVTCSSSPNGKKACYILDNFSKIALDEMGEGVPNILGLVVDLCVAENKLFVIEEPENDIHPRALKELLAFVVEKSRNNQFIITTHSNVVTRYLGVEPETKIFKVDMEFKGKVPTSKVELVENNPEARQSLLEHLGYELVDLDLWEGWLFLEESSAEKIIREYLIPWFAPSLQGRLRTYSARSLDEVESKFDDFNRLFGYLSLQPTYKNRAWVIVDSGEREETIVQKLKETYGPSGWKPDNFQQFEKHDFESYYPDEFKEKVAEALSGTDKKDKRGKMAKKKALLGEVEAWIRNNPAGARTGFQKSAAEVIGKLTLIQDQMVPQPKT